LTEKLKSYNAASKQRACQRLIHEPFYHAFEALVKITIIFLAMAAFAKISIYFCSLNLY
jgi:hypothetical protein